MSSCWCCHAGKKNYKAENAESQWEHGMYKKNEHEKVQHCERWTESTSHWQQAWVNFIFI